MALGYRGDNAPIVVTYLTTYILPELLLQWT